MNVRLENYTSPYKSLTHCALNLISFIIESVYQQESSFGTSDYLAQSIGVLEEEQDTLVAQQITGSFVH